MPAFEILVQYSSGARATGRRVALGGFWGLSDTEYTDQRGRAVLVHSSSSPHVYVDGRDHGGVSPGKTIVTLG